MSQIKLETDVNQLPTNILEEERFAYFYKDQLTNLYNYQYLDTILINYQGFYHFAYVILLHKFSEYNKHYGWKHGNLLLAELAFILKEKYGEKGLVFRVFGDDFIILSHEEISISKEDLESFLRKADIDFDVIKLDMSTSAINNIASLESQLQSIGLY